MVQLIDPFNRVINYLRISITDRCNLRCIYCMPPEGVVWRPHQEILTYEEITKLVTLSASLGITGIRITGGEPLVRRDLPDLICSLASIPGIEDISLTTNGFLLEKFANLLKEAGLNRVNISLDTLNEIKFSRITRHPSFTQVWKGILAAEKAGLYPIKINAVILRGVNDNELVELARLTIEHDWEVRFIEFMPVANEQEWGAGFPLPEDRYISVQEIQECLRDLHLEVVEGSKGNGPARIYRIPGALGTLGFISPIGEHFCENCNRLRLTADGNFRPCLLNNLEIPVRDVLRSGGDVKSCIIQAINLKPEGHELNGRAVCSDRKMVQIGG